MKKLLLFVLTFSLSLGLAKAQINKEIDASGVKDLNIYVDNAKLVVEGISGNKILIETNDLKPLPARAKGLRPLYNNASDNTGAGMEMTKEGTKMTLKKARSGSGRYVIKVPSGINLKLTETDWTGDHIEAHKMKGEIEVSSKNSDIILKEISGPVTASTTSGDIEVVFADINQSKPTFLSSISGHVDVTIGDNQKANLVLSSISGEVYTNHELKTETKDNLKIISRSKIQSVINGGGVEVRLKSISGDLYLRK